MTLIEAKRSVLKQWKRSFRRVGDRNPSALDNEWYVTGYGDYEDWRQRLAPACRIRARRTRHAMAYQTRRLG